MKSFLILLLAFSTVVADDLPKTLMTTRGKLLVSEDFTPPLAPVTGKPVGFASGFSGWRYNAGPAGGKSGQWKLADGCFIGMESPEAHHPATASLGFQFTNAIIQCEVRLNDVPDEGRKYRSLFVKATDVKDYVISLSVGPGGLFLTPYDADRINPATRQREKGPAGRVSTPVKLNEWHTVVLEILGDEVVGTLDGKSTTLSNKLIGTAKHSIMLGASTESSFRHLRVWEALPNKDWDTTKPTIPTNTKP
ncbi:hypothetical protein [Prosthecobacter sp.]|uniref:hypothetical protein n=1 Tax=Prosthecobacter sp. TaxID=1965333 RepID=UPI001DEDC902|nr:hypothetical protein [Prosthecobacter sp.]MCB1275706.1 hypothetical protein [Prosthecobacter sp.]